MLWLLTLPFKLVLGLFLLPFLILRIVLKVLVAIVLLPIVLVVGFLFVVLGGLALVFAVLAPLVPFILLALLVAAIVKLASRPAIVCSTVQASFGMSRVLADT